MPEHVPTVIIPGTWGTDELWWRPRAPFWREATKQGVELIDEAEPFSWPSDIDGVWGKNTRWKLAGRTLFWYVRLKHEERKRKGLSADPVNLIAHSHGGQAALYAAAYGLRIGTLITVATPVRRDMEDVIFDGIIHIKRWVHIRSDSTDLFQRLGALFDGRFDLIWNYRDMRQADVSIVEPGVGHGALLDPVLWTKQGWWSYLI